MGSCSPQLTRQMRTWCPANQIDLFPSRFSLNIVYTPSNPMDAPFQSLTDNAADSLNNLHTSKAQMAAPLADTVGESNPCQDQTRVFSQPTKPMELHAPDPSAIDKSIHVPPEPDLAPMPEPDRDVNTEEVLNEFDPLTD